RNQPERLFLETIHPVQEEGIDQHRHDASNNRLRHAHAASSRIAWAMGLRSDGNSRLAHLAYVEPKCTAKLLSLTSCAARASASRNASGVFSKGCITMTARPYSRRMWASLPAVMSTSCF